MRERNTWIDWDTPGRRTSQGQRNDTRSWKRVPNVDDARVILDDVMAQGHLPKSDYADIDITPFAHGYSNVLFLVHCKDWDFQTTLLRIAMPYDPWYQTESEVASMMKAAQAGLPVPACIMFDSSGENELGLEWMLLEKIDARSLEAVYTKELCGNQPHIFDPKGTAGHRVLQEVATYSRTLESTPFQHIGSLYFNWERTRFHIGPIVDEDFLAEDTYPHSEGLRGPYHSVEEYLNCLAEVKSKAALDYIFENRNIRGPDKPRRKLAGEFLGLVNNVTSGLVTALNKVYHAQAPRGDGPFHGSWAYFQHEDLHVGNILVGDNPGDESMVKGIVDWGGCRVMPHFMRKSHGVPKINEVFLEENFPRADIFNASTFEAYDLTKRCFAHRPVARELAPQDEHVSVATMVLNLWYRQVKKSDPRVEVDSRPIIALENFVDCFVRSGCQ
ncbi:phosphotransferase [Candidatus Bathyarchaeota archaeon]|nr:phosphotransferase [Candidatus Bathyarchaeota archaeon]